MAVLVDTELCKGCELCLFYCPKDVFVVGGRVNRKGYNTVLAAFPERCSSCKMCEMYCPDLAISVE